MVKIFFVSIALLFPLWVVAQETIALGENNYDDSKGIIYDREVTADLKLHTNGWAFGVNIGQVKTYYLTNYWNFEFGELKHRKEMKQSFDIQPFNSDRTFRSFIYGKQNNFFALRGGFGQKRYLSEKAKRKGVAIGLTYEGGATMGILKPYYLELRYFAESGVNDFIVRSERFSEENRDKFLDINSIYGASGFARGLGELSIVPGLHGKAAVHIDWGAFDEFVKALEAGVMFDLFFQEVPIMVETPLIEDGENQALFVNLYINLQLGKRW